MAEQYVKLSIRIDTAVTPHASIAGMIEITQVIFEGVVGEGSIVEFPIGLGFTLKMHFGDNDATITLVAEEVRGVAAGHDDGSDNRLLEQHDNRLQVDPQDDREDLTVHAGDNMHGQEDLTAAVDPNALASFLMNETEDAWMGVAGPSVLFDQGCILQQMSWETTGLEISGAGTWVCEESQTP